MTNERAMEILERWAARGWTVRIRPRAVPGEGVEMLVTVGAYWVGESSQGTVAGCVEYIIEHAGVPGTL